MVRASDDQPVANLRAGTAKVRDLQWAGSSHLLVTSSVTGEVVIDLASPKSEWFLVISYNLKTGSSRNILDNAEGALDAVSDSPAIRILGGKPYAFVQALHFIDNLGRVSVFKVELDTDSDTLVIDGAPSTDEWAVGPDGQPLAESRYNAERGHWLLRVKQKNGWSVAQSIDTGYGSKGLLGLGRDGRSVLVSASKDGKEALREFSADTQAWGEPFGAEDGVEAIYDPVTEQLIGTHALVGDADDYQFLAPLDRQIWAATVKAFPGQRVTLQNLSADHEKLLVRVDLARPRARPTRWSTSPRARQATSATSMTASPPTTSARCRPWPTRPRTASRSAATSPCPAARTPRTCR